MFVYLQERPGEFRIVRLARESQALALGLQDLDGDGRLDIHVGNDFALPDAVFLAAGGRWERAEPLAAMTRNTMSLDAGDVDNDGVDELFATDMKPYRPTRKEEDRWYFVVVGMEELPPEDPQVVRNVLLRRAGDGYRDVAVPAGVDASGWSWSSRLGDLDQDGFLDIYVVNGMVSAELFGQLPGAELTERNLAFRNRGDGTFTEAAEWALDDTAGGRGMTMADLDDDGDLDIAVNNLLSPAVVFENRLCGGASLQVALRRPGSGNHYALGARVSLVTSAGTYVRQMRSTAGYLSGEPPRLHFGLPAGARIDALTIVWPDGRTSHVRGEQRRAGVQAGATPPGRTRPHRDHRTFILTMSRERPNVVFVLTDDQGYGDLGCHGNDVIRTPNLDRHHADGVRFTDFHVGTTCAPTRSGLLTGHDCNSAGVWHTIGGRSLLREDEWTLADALREAGYRTGHFGKWHLGDSQPFRPHERGFERSIYHAGGGIGNTGDPWGNDYFDDTYYVNGDPERFAGYCTDVFFREGLRFIEEHREEPFFCYIATNAPHTPLNVEPRYVAMYRDAVPHEDRARFYGMITNIDENFGALTRRLEELGLADDTIVVFMTDNGTATGVELDADEHPARGRAASTPACAAGRAHPTRAATACRSCCATPVGARWAARRRHPHQLRRLHADDPRSVWTEGAGRPLLPRPQPAAPDPRRARRRLGGAHRGERHPADRPPDEVAEELGDARPMAAGQRHGAVRPGSRSRPAHRRRRGQPLAGGRAARRLRPLVGAGVRAVRPRRRHRRRGGCGAGAAHHP